MDYEAQLDMALQGYNPSVHTQPQKKKKNFWLDQISTVGGIAGGIAGTAAAPIFGTAAGAGIGSGLGEAIENAISGESLGKNVLKEGALGAVFGGGPIKLAKAGLGAKAALKAGTATGLGEALKIGGGEAAKFSLRGAAGKKALEGADKAIIKQFGFTPSQLTNFKGKFGEDALSVIKKHSIQSADDVATRTGVLQSAFDDIVPRIGEIPKKQIQTALSSTANKYIKSPSLADQALGRQLKAQADEILRNAPEKLSGETLSGLRKVFDKKVPYSLRGTPEDNLNREIAGSLRGVLQKSADKAGLGFEGKSFKEIGKDLNKLYDLEDIVEKQANLGRGASPLGLRTLLGGAAGGGAGGPLGSLAGMAGTAAVNSPTGRKLAAKGAGTLGEGLVSSGARAATKSQSPMGIATRLGGIGAVRGFAGQQPEQAQGLEGAIMDAQGQSNQNSVTSPTNTPASSPNIMGSPYDQTGQMSSQQQDPYPKENLLYDIQRDPANAKDYIAQYQQLQEIFAAPEVEEPKALSEGQQARADLMTSLGMAEDVIGQGSINFGPIGSRVEGIKSIFNAADPETQTYKNIIGQVRGAITKARAGASLTAGELKLLDTYTPKDTDSEQVVMSKLKQLRSLYGNEQPQGRGTLEDTIMAAQERGY